MGAVWWKMRVQCVVLGPWLKVIILDILPESRQRPEILLENSFFVPLDDPEVSSCTHKYVAWNSKRRPFSMVLGPWMWSLYCDSGKQRQKTKNVIVSTRKVFSVRFCEYKIICFSFKDFRQQSRRVSHMSVDKRFSAWSKTITKNSICIRGIKKRELVDMYRDNFQNIFRKQRLSLFIWRSFIQPRSYIADQGPLSEICWYFSRVDKMKNSVYSNMLPTAEMSWSENLFYKKASPPVAFRLFTG